MSYSVEEVWNALEYAAVSPFVKKMQGDRYRDEEALIAEKIYNMSAKIATEKKRHENALNVLDEAAKKVEPYADAIVECMNKQKTAIEKRAEKAQQEYDAVPKKDDAFISSCRQELEKITARKKEKESEIRHRLEEKFETAVRNRKKRLIIYVIGSMIGIISLLFLINMDPYGPVGLGLLLIAGTSIGATLLIVGIIDFFAGKPVPASEADIQQEINKAMPEYDRTVAEITENIEVGYAVGSDFHHALLREMDKVQAELREAGASCRVMSDIAVMWGNDFKNGVSLLQEAVENFEALSTWAANYLQDQEQKEHNKKMLAIEEEKLREQIIASQAQENAIRQQNELLERQARSAEQQARDSAEIRRRMENERYGEHWKTSNN